MRIDFDKAVQVINLLVEGVGINATSRLAGVNKRTVLDLLILVGQRCEKLMDARMRNLAINDVQMRRDLELCCEERKARQDY